MDGNYWIVLVTAFIPMILGFIWYNPKTFEPAWMKETGLTREDIDGGNMLVIFGTAFVMSILLGLGLMSIVIHQFGLFSLFASQPDFAVEGSEMAKQYAAMAEQVAGRHRSFGHGVFHGAITGFFLVLPVLLNQALFERKSLKYVGINASYWILTVALMGGVICKFF